MSELVQTLWFEDTSFLNEQMLDTPVGRFSIRQMSIFLVFGLLAWIATLALADLVFKIVVAGAIFVTGTTLFTRKTKTVSPETHLLYLIKKGSLQTTKQKKTPQIKGKQSGEQTFKNILLSTTIGVPVKIAGVLKDFSGKILADKNFKVTINNTAHSNGTTDQEGYFYTYFIPDHPGLFEVNIQPENQPNTTQKITIQANPPQKTEQKKEEKEEKEAPQNAQKTLTKL